MARKGRGSRTRATPKELKFLRGSLPDSGLTTKVSSLHQTDSQDLGVSKNEGQTNEAHQEVGVALVATAVSVSACSSPADTVSHNLSNDADHFNIERRIVLINGITDKYLMVIEGRCSLGNDDPPRQLSVTCQVGPDSYTKSFFGLSDNVTFSVEQLRPAKVNEYHYQVNFRPETIIPDIRN